MPISARSLAGKAKRALPIELRHYARLLPIASNTVLYESFAGNGALCHPEAIFRAVHAAPDLQHLDHVWVIDDLDAQVETVAALREMPRVSVVRRLSASYYRHLATAGWLVNNATFPPTFGKRPGQTYLNTWHGTPLKTMGFDEPSGAMAARNVVRNFLQADFVVSGSRFMTETMYERAYRLDNIVPALSIIEEGNPRTDAQFLSDAGREEVIARLRESGVALPDGARVVLYAPTWRGSSFTDPDDDLDQLAADVTALQRDLPDGHVVLVKVHQQVSVRARAHPVLGEALVPNAIPTNLVLGVTDVLVTDFSSIFFDFIVTGRPVVFYAPDRAGYLAERGVYPDEHDLPGPWCDTVPELAATVASVGTGSSRDPFVTHQDSYAAALSRFAPHDDGSSSERVVDIVFRGRRDGYRVAPPRHDNVPRLLIYLGGMKSNGITSSALSLLDHLDLSEVDVTALCDDGGEDQTSNITAIPGGVRVLARAGTYQPGKASWVRRQIITTTGESMTARSRDHLRAMLHPEWRRLLGNATFDHIVDFSGYSPLWAFVMSQGLPRSRAIWQHNDLRADQLRRVGRRSPHRRNLGAVFAAYAFYDRIVSVSPALRDINARNLAEFAPPEKFVAARNLIDAERVRAAALDDADGMRLDPPGPSEYRFVTVGRLSPEKSHERLLRAFAVVHGRHPGARLLVIGDGPLRGGLAALAAELGVADAVVFAGLVRNPWALMAQCDGFVLSSDYEGQPMVILEARVLGLPVVSTAFGSVAGAIEDGTDGVVVERSVEALTRGMEALVAGEVPCPPFDAAAYNTEAVGEFNRAVGLDVDDHGRGWKSQ